MGKFIASQEKKIIEENINKIPNKIYREVLYEYFINLRTLEDCGKIMYMSRSTYYLAKKRAMKMYLEIIG